ncbi:Glyoxalase/Bleomycin resistance protein/Dioxygenase superfamily protein [Mycobacterium basiliense]|uniref:Glyoxalase/Bleomycin resistance protein/Dioxygenase superfamily protein n=1 Tax=Mycobacterium basiliense TaxID=2094119 RepID=A0A3S4FRN4_9MYCO|nr:VOC family protein [Mycobacterium basiliense]VDM89189.1 Glyoxalase/Bleomycin resistance protein/Dioxygenase superfamily protein [Mycobacterium basiliense]
MLSLHHAHLMCSDIDATLDFLVRGLGADVIRDVDFAGARNVLLQLGSGHVHLYDQAPKHPGQGTVHHLGIQSDDLETARKRLQDIGASVTEIRSDPLADYLMAQGPDKLLLEIFAPRAEVLAELPDYFAMNR